MRSKVLKPIAAFLLILSLLVLVLFFIVQTRYFRQFVKIITNSVVTSVMDQNFTIGSIEGNFLRGITLKNVTFQIEGEDFVHCDEIFIDYSLPLILDSSMLFRRILPLDKLLAKGVTVRLVHYPDDSWNFEKLEALRQEKQADPLDWNFIIGSAIVGDMKIILDDLPREETTEYRLNDVELSLKMYKTVERVEISLKKGEVFVKFDDPDMREFHFDQFSGDAVYTLADKSDSMDITRLDFNYSGIRVTGEAHIKNLRSPDFKFRAHAGEINIGGIARTELELRGRGSYELYKHIRATGRAELRNSTLRGQPVTGEIKSIGVDGASIDFKGGTLKTDLGDISFGGNLLLMEIADKHEKNSFDVDLALNSVKTASVMDIVKKTEDLGSDEVGVDLDAILNSSVNMKGSWSKNHPLEMKTDIRNLELAGGEAGEINLSGEVEIRGPEVIYDLSSKFINANLAPVLRDEIYESRLNADLSLKGGIRSDAQFPQGFSADVRGEFSGSEILNLHIKRAQANISYDKNHFNISSLDIDSDEVKLQARGKLGATGGGRINYSLSVPRLSFLTSFSEDMDYEGKLNAEGALTGSVDNPRLALSLLVSGFKSEKNKVEAKVLDLDGNTGFDLSNVKLTVNGVAKGIKIQDRSFQSIGLYANGQSGVVDGKLEVIETYNRDYKADFRVTDFEDGHPALELDNVALNVQNTVLKNREPVKLEFLQDKVTVSSLNLYHKDNFLVGDLELGSGNEIQADMTLEKLSLPDISGILDVPFPLKGTVSGHLKIGRTLDQPDINASIKAKDIEYMNFMSDDISMDLVFNNNSLNLNLNILNDSDSILTAQAQANINLGLKDPEKIINQATYNVSVVSKGLDISPIAAMNPEIQNLEGKLLADIRATGDGAKPNVSGSIQVRDVDLKVYSLRNRVKIPSATLDLQGLYGILEPVKIDSGGGEGTFEGRIDFRTLEYSGKGVLSGMLFKSYPDDVTANLDGQIDVKGKFLNARITGNVTAQDLYAIVPEKPVKYIEHITFTDDGRKERDEFIFTGEKPEDYYIEYISMNLAVDIPKDSWVKGSGANIEVSGKLDITKEYGHTHVVTGNIDVVRGDYQFMGKLFNIQGGSVSFRGKEVINPFLDVHALYEVASVEVFINITGTALEPRIQLSSDPPLDENEIVSYLVFGTSTEQLSSDERLLFQHKAGEFLGSMAVDEIRDMFGDQFALDVITIKGGQAGFSDTHFEVGKYITEDLYVGYERLSYERYFYERYFFSPGVSASTVTANRAVIEYRVFDFMTLESEIGDESGADVFFNFDY